MKSLRQLFLHRGRLVTFAIVLDCTISLALAGSTPAKAEAVTEQQAYEIGIEAYVYLQPLIMMDVTRRLSINLPAGVKPGMGPVNIFHHMRTFPPADFREVVRPNFDTLYSTAWLDLTQEPMVVSAQDTSGRYYLATMELVYACYESVATAREGG